MWAEASGGAALTRAQYLLALVLVAVFPVFISNIPLQTHAVWQRLLPPEIVGSPSYRTWLEPGKERFPAGAANRPDLHSLSIALPPWAGAPLRAEHLLELTPGGVMLFDGRAVDFLELRHQIELLSVNEPAEWLEFRPHAEAHYERFAEILGLISYAGFDRLIIDNGPFRNAPDEHVREWEASLDALDRARS